MKHADSPEIPGCIIVLNALRDISLGRSGNRFNVPPCPLSMVKCRLAVFDADGTLFNSEQAVFSSIRHTARELGLPEISEAQMRTHLGPPLDQ